MTLPKGWEDKEVPLGSIGTNSKKKALRMYDENEVWNLVTRAIVRLGYDAIATYEARGLDMIPVDWLRDYIDDISVNFPRVQE